MKNLGCLLLAIFLAAKLPAQKVYFAYFETENNTPFSIRMGEKVFSAAASGYCILSNLADSSYTISLGFPSSASEIRFRVPVDGKDHGYLIKQFDFGWGLFDLQSMHIIKPFNQLSGGGVSYQYRYNDFTALLARASNDTTLFYIPVIMKDVAVVKQPEVIAAAVKEEKETADPQHALQQEKSIVQENLKATLDSIELLIRDSITTVATPEIVYADTATILTALVDTTAVVQVTPEEQPADSLTTDIVVKTEAEKTDSVLVVQDPIEMVTDSAVVIEEEIGKPVISQEALAERSQVKRHAESSTSEGFGLVFYDQTNEGTDTIRLIIPNPRIVFKVADTTQFENGMLELSAEKTVKNEEQKKQPSCDSSAAYQDFFSLRKNMAGRETEEEMVKEAKAAFERKCFSTEQLRNLSALFLTAAGKYAFFEAALGHVSDPTLFHTLGAEIRDDHYFTRFKALMGE